MVPSLLSRLLPPSNSSPTAPPAVRPQRHRPMDQSSWTPKPNHSLGPIGEVGHVGLSPFLPRSLSPLSFPCSLVQPPSRPLLSTLSSILTHLPRPLRAALPPLLGLPTSPDQPPRPPGSAAEAEPLLWRLLLLLLHPAHQQREEGPTSADNARPLLDEAAAIFYAVTDRCARWPHLFTCIPAFHLPTPSTHRPFLWSTLDLQ